MNESMEALRKKKIGRQLKVKHALPEEHDSFRQKQMAIMVERMDSLGDLDSLQKK